MKRTLFAAVIGFVLVGAVTAPSEERSRGQGTVVGWFSCDRCAPESRVKAKQVSPANRDCVQKCVSEGAGLVFLDERARVSSVKVLKEYVAKCSRPEK